MYKKYLNTLPSLGRSSNKLLLFKFFNVENPFLTQCILYRNIVEEGAVE